MQLVGFPVLAQGRSGLFNSQVQLVVLKGNIERDQQFETKVSANDFFEETYNIANDFLKE